MLNLSNKRRGPGIFPGNYERGPAATFFEKQKKKQKKQKKSLSFLFPAYLLYLPGNLKSLKWHSCI